MRYLIVEIETTYPLPQISIPPGYDGIAAVLRCHDRPAGFFMQALNRKGFPQEELARLVERYAKLVPPLEVFDNFPSLTVAVCTRDRTPLVARCLESLRKLQIPGQATGPIFEILVVDNAPTDDGTRKLVESLPSVRYALESKPGLDFARNRAIQEASGELLAFVDDDATIDRSWLEGLKTAWAENPDAGGFTGPVLPLELTTTAQILFEGRGGFGHEFRRIRFTSSKPGSSVYPCGAEFGCGCNMAFPRDVLMQLGGFDEALDTGPPLPGGGDLDILYRVIRAGFPVVYQPQLLVYHQHRREYAALRHQMWTWGLASMAFFVKSYHTDPSQRPKLRRVVRRWLVRKSGKLLLCLLGIGRYPWPPDLAAAELLGGIVGLLGEYGRSRKRIERIRRTFAWKSTSEPCGASNL